jgi:hypothetical protein
VPASIILLTTTSAGDLQGCGVGKADVLLSEATPGLWLAC